ncbi:hypothetical protein HT746_00225 [Burkholderia pyrrocinia]|nr:hypothetical protein [Burkholderia pyrrocinia]
MFTAFQQRPGWYEPDAAFVPGAQRDEPIGIPDCVGGRHHATTVACRDGHDARCHQRRHTADTPSDLHPLHHTIEPPAIRDPRSAIRERGADARPTDALLPASAASAGLCATRLHCTTKAHKSAQSSPSFLVTIRNTMPRSVFYR